ncbi:MAG: hypothetical protein M3247_07230 [Thermoproteota archaeon]|nr:hypothetical protein [Thermoproteota archaeon]
MGRERVIGIVPNQYGILPLPTVSDKLNIMASIHNRKLIAALSRELKEKDSEIQQLRHTVTALESKLNELSIQIKT